MLDVLAGHLHGTHGVIRSGGSAGEMRRFATQALQDPTRPTSIRMRFFRRSLIALGVAATLPTIVFAAVGIFYFLRAERSQVEAATLGRSFTVITLSEAALRGNLSALNVLATSLYFDTENWQVFYPRVQRVLLANPQWETIRLFNMKTREEVFDLRKPFGPPRPLEFPDEDDLALLQHSGEPLVGGVDTTSEPLIYIYLPILREQQLKYVIAAAIRPKVFQDLLLAQVPTNTIAAVVDRHGRFLARTHDYERRVGQPATQYVRDAMRNNERGFYRGTTYEGFENYTAFYTSPWSGWSAHVAVASTLIDTPTSWSFVVAGVAGLGSALLAGVLVMLVLRDMAERRRAEEALRQSQKMEAVGQLTGGIAHDFNNLLTAIIGNLDMIRTRTADNERLQRLSNNALDAAQRGAKLTAQLLAFSRNQRMELAPVDLERLLGGMIGLLRQSVGPSIVVSIEIAPEARTVMSDANQLELALLNLAVNARDAMPGGGAVAISTHLPVDLDLRALPKRSYAEIRVCDNGSGMSDEIRTRAMEPFFTTKQVGQGTGLGLSQVYGVVRESGGAVFVESESGRGTRIRMILPLANTNVVLPAPRDSEDRTPTVRAPRHDRETSILLVDDDRQVRRFVADSLQSLGYRVVDLAAGAPALALLNETRFDLLVVDFAMPGMNGAQVARAAQERQPGLRVLIISGYADSAAIKAALGSAPLLHKPFDVTELGTAVAEVLGEHE